MTLKQLVEAIQTAYSYKRFSKAEQKRGDSLRRQTELINEYCAENNLELADLTFEDLGVSAFRSRNSAEDYGLGQFLLALSEGKLKTPCTLLVENIDRLSRDNLHPALAQFVSILSYDVTIVDLHRGRAYTKDMDATGYIIALLDMERANNESKLKSDRVLKARKSRLQNEDGSQRATVNKWLTAPFWITRNDKKEYELNDFHQLVIDVCAMSVGGLSAAFIARELNHQGIPTPKGKKWYPSSITNILTNPALVGDYLPCKKVFQVGKGTFKDVPTGQVFQNHYPAAIDRSFYNSVQAGLKSRSKKRTKGRSESQLNLIKGISTCYCGSSITLKKQPKAYYLQCATGECTNKPLNLRYLKDWLNEVWLTADYAPVSAESVPENDELTALQSELAQVEADLTFWLGRPTSHPQIAEKVDALSAQSAALTRKIADKVTELSPYTKAQADLEERTALVQAAFAEDNEPTTLAARGRLTSALAQLKALNFFVEQNGVATFTVINAQGETHHYDSAPRPYAYPPKHTGNVWTKRII